MKNRIIFLLSFLFAFSFLKTPSNAYAIQCPGNAEGTCRSVCIDNEKVDPVGKCRGVLCCVSESTPIIGSECPGNPEGECKAACNNRNEKNDSSGQCGTDLYCCVVQEANPGGGSGTVDNLIECDVPGSGKAGINTAIGCIPYEDGNSLVSFILGWAMGIAGGIALILIIVAGFQIITSSGDPKKLQAGKELLTSAISGLLLLIFSAFILRIIGVNILGII